MSHLYTEYTLLVVFATRYKQQSGYTIVHTCSNTFHYSHHLCVCSPVCCCIMQCRTLRCRRLAQETVGTESQGRSNRPVPSQTETPNRGERDSTVEMNKHCHNICLSKALSHAQKYSWRQVHTESVQVQATASTSKHIHWKSTEHTTKYMLHRHM